MCEAPKKRDEFRLWRVVAAAVVAGFGMAAMGQDAVAPQKQAAVIHKTNPAVEVLPAQAQPNSKSASGIENAMLLQLARELKADVDRTNKDVLSLDVIRKAREIEQFTKQAEREMATNRGGSAN